MTVLHYVLEKSRMLSYTVITETVSCVYNDVQYNIHLTAFSWFLSHVSILLLTRDIDIAILSVRLSVRDTLVLYENGLTYRHSFSTVR